MKQTALRSQMLPRTAYLGLFPLGFEAVTTYPLSNLTTWTSNQINKAALFTGALLELQFYPISEI